MGLVANWQFRCALQSDLMYLDLHWSVHINEPFPEPFRCVTSLTFVTLIIVHRVPYPSISDFVVTFPLRVFLWIPIDALCGVWRVECIPSDDGDWAKSKTDTGHDCGMYMWFVDVYIGCGKGSF